MRFLTAYYWQQTWNGDENTSSLLLQQYVCEGVCVHFSCVCGGLDGDDRAGGYMTEQLLWWFRGLSLKRLVRKPEKMLGKAEAGLRRVIQRADAELAGAGSADSGLADIRPPDAGKAALAGIFCVGEEFFLFCRGEQRIYLVNTGFGRAYVKRLGAENSGFSAQRGVLQPDVGLLFAAESFWNHVTEQMIKETLSVREVITEEQIGKHLGELGQEAQRQGGKNMAAVFVRTVQGG